MYYKYKNKDELRKILKNLITSEIDVIVRESIPEGILVIGFTKDILNMHCLDKPKFTLSNRSENFGRMNIFSVDKTVIYQRKHNGIGIEFWTGMIEDYRIILLSELNGLITP